MSETSLKASVSGHRREQLGKGEKGRRTLEQIVFTPTVHHLRGLENTTKSKEPGGGDKENNYQRVQKGNAHEHVLVFLAALAALYLPLSLMNSFIH